ncbi:MAG: hypothetical protein AAGA77_14455 [Bacteroidota bacterium]
MKPTIVFVLICLSNLCHAQNILDHFGIQEIKKIEISFSPHMNQINTDNKVVKITSDSIFIDKIYFLLSRLPDTGQIFKSFPSSIPTWEIQITDQSEVTHKLTYYGVKLRVPNGSNGTFYRGAPQQMALEKDLYLAIRAFMLGSWYNCS